MKEPLLSIIIPVYNEEKHLSSCLSSLKQQSYKNKEIIVVDDGSTDKSREIATKHDVRLYIQKHQGPGSARNLGAKRARGEILVFLDGDMEFEKNYLKYLTYPIFQKKAIGTFHGQELVSNPDNIWSKCWTINSDLPPGSRLPKDLNPKSGIFRAIIKKVFLINGGFDSRDGYFDDGSFWKKTGIESLLVPEAKCYHFNPENLKDIFYSSSWIGKSGYFSKNIENFLRFSFLNSLRIGLRNVFFRSSPLRFIPFKIVFDLGMFRGIFLEKKGSPK